MTHWARSLAGAAILIASCPALGKTERGGPTPGFYLPGVDDVRRFVSGRGVVIGMVGDSLASPTAGQVIPGSNSHVNWGIGLRLECGFHEGLKGLWIPDGIYRNVDGVGANNLGGIDNNNIRQRWVRGADPSFPFFGVAGSNIETQALTELHWKPEGTPPSNINFMTYELYGDEGPGVLITNPFPTAASLGILRGDLRAAAFVYRRAGEFMPTGLTADVVDRNGATLVNLSNPVPIPALQSGEPDDWYPLVFNLSAVDTTTPAGKTRNIRFRLRSYPDPVNTPPGSTAYVRGCLLFDNASQGAMVVPMAGLGGWNTANLRFDQTGSGGGASEDTPEAFGRVALAYGFADPSKFRVLIVGIGQNILSNGQVSGTTTTEIYKEDVRAIVEQRIAAVEDAGGGVDQVILLGTHPWGPSGNAGEILRAKTRSDQLYALAVEEEWWYIGIPYLIDPWPITYYYHGFIDYHLSLAGARAYGSALWGSFLEAAGPWPCEGDADGDGGVGFSDLVEVLSRWAEPADHAFARGDADGDASVGFNDVVAVLSRWGETCE